MNKVKFQKTSKSRKCYICNGLGIIYRNKTKKEICSRCNGTGVYDNKAYILIAEKPNGQKIAFATDDNGK